LEHEILRFERAMGIENTAPEPLIFLNQGITISAERRVRLLCEKWRHTSQRQPMRQRFKASAVRPKQGKSTFFGGA
jgi:hypothetical protein